MGLSVVAVYAIVGVAVLTGATAIVVQGLNTWEDVERARRYEADLAASKANSALHVYDVVWTDASDELTVKVNNTGSETLNVTLVDILVDGVVVTGSIASRTVDGVSSTNIWAPGQQLVMVVSGVASAPTTSVKVVAENGANAVWVI